MICILVSILCTFTIDTYGHIHVHANETLCFLDEDWDNDYHYSNLNINHYSLIIQYSLNAIGCMFYYTVVKEFICSQSPHAMKDL